MKMCEINKWGDCCRRDRNRRVVVAERCLPAREGASAKLNGKCCVTFFSPVYFSPALELLSHEKTRKMFKVCCAVNWASLRH